MKRILSLILVVAMLLCMSVATYAENELALKLSVKNPDVGAGDTVTVDVSFANNPGVTGSVIDITYDSAVLTLVSVEKGALLENAFFASKSDVPGTVCVDFAAIAALTGDAAICTLTFTVKDDAAIGATTLTAASEDTTDGAVNPAQLTVGTGSLALNVVDFLWGDVNNDGVADMSDAVLILRYEANLMGVEGFAKPKAADTDGNGVYDMNDAVLILRYEANLYDPAA